MVAEVLRKSDFPVPALRLMIDERLNNKPLD